ncbi:MAG: hypothetical protein NT051_01105 [Candidatus Micrarchaeota archaeon]|nr:hypothetical protein [Candidatus Micrarchaeota archaeon]
MDIILIGATAGSPRNAKIGRAIKKRLKQSAAVRALVLVDGLAKGEVFLKENKNVLKMAPKLRKACPDRWGNDSRLLESYGILQLQQQGFAKACLLEPRAVGFIAGLHESHVPYSIISDCSGIIDASLKKWAPKKEKESNEFRFFDNIALNYQLFADCGKPPAGAPRETPIHFSISAINPGLEKDMLRSMSKTILDYSRKFRLDISSRYISAACWQKQLKGESLVFEIVGMERLYEVYHNYSTSEVWLVNPPKYFKYGLHLNKDTKLREIK